MTDSARFECVYCRSDVDTTYRYLFETANLIVWDCPVCLRENDGELDVEDPDRWRS